MKKLEQIGLQNVADEISSIEVYMVYATPYNFMGEVLYGGPDEAYLVPEIMEKQRKANELLRKKRLDLHMWSMMRIVRALSNNKLMLCLLPKLAKN